MANSIDRGRRLIASGLACTLLGWTRVSDAFTPIKPFKPLGPRPWQQLRDFLHEHDPIHPKEPPPQGGQGKYRDLFKFKTPRTNTEPASPPAAPAAEFEYFAPAGKVIPKSQVAAAARVAYRYQASVSDIKIDGSSVGAHSDEAHNAEQLMARVLHSAIERATAAAGSDGDRKAQQQALVAALKASDDQGTRSIDAGVWTSKCNEEIGGIRYKVTVKEPFTLFFWDNDLGVRVEPANLLATRTTIDLDKYCKT